MTTARKMTMPAWCSMFVAVCLMLLGTTALDASAADGRDGIDLTISPGTQYSQRFSWLHWWETERANAQRFGTVDEQAHWAIKRLAAVEPYRQLLIETLVPIVKDTGSDPYVRAGAVMALARMRYEKLVGLIVSDKAPAADSVQRVGPSGQPWPVGVVGDEHVRVRVAGWLALGLLDTEESRARLRDEFVWAVTIDDEIARVAAFGFLKEMSVKEREFLVMTMRNSEIAEVQRMAIWSLDQHDDKVNDELMQAAIQELRSPYSVAQALQATGSMQRLKTQQLLQRVIAQPDELDELTVFNHIERGTVWQSTCTFGVDKQLTVSAMLTLMHIDPAGGDTDAAIRKALVNRIENGPATADAHTVSSPHYDTGPAANYDRGPAALALAMQADSRRDLNDSVRTLRQLLEDGATKTKVLVYPRDESDVRDRKRDPIWEYREMKQHGHPARGYAAVAMGLLLQRMNPQTQLGQDCPITLRSTGEYRNVTGDLTRPLLKVLANRHELTELRSAAAIAMGLSGREAFREPLREALGDLDAGDAALYGYIVEALAMLDDPDVPQLVEQYLTKAQAARHDDDLLSRRALASALIFSSHSPEDIDDLLTQAWPHDPWAGLALARASAVKGDGAIVGYLIEQLDDPQHAAAAAMSLAEVVDPQSPWRMSRLTDGMNYTLDYRTPVQISWNPYVPGDQAPLPTRLVAGFDNPYLMHNLLMRRLPDGATMANINNDDSNGLASFMFKPTTARAGR